MSVDLLIMLNLTCSIGGTGMLGTLIGLFIVHRRQRDTEREKRAQYWREQVNTMIIVIQEASLNFSLPQNAFHQSLRQMRETARASILSLPGNGGNSARSTMYSRDGLSGDESQAPILQHAAPKASGLRHYLSEDGSSEYDEPDAYIMHSTEHRGEGRF